MNHSEGLLSCRRKGIPPFIAPTSGLPVSPKEAKTKTNPPPQKKSRVNKDQDLKEIDSYSCSRGRESGVGGGRSSTTREKLGKVTVQGQRPTNTRKCKDYGMLPLAPITPLHQQVSSVTVDDISRFCQEQAFPAVAYLGKPSVNRENKTQTREEFEASGIYSYSKN